MVKFKFDFDEETGDILAESDEGIVIQTSTQSNYVSLFVRGKNVPMRIFSVKHSEKINTFRREFDDTLGGTACSFTVRDGINPFELDYSNLG